MPLGLPARERVFTGVHRCSPVFAVWGWSV